VFPRPEVKSRLRKFVLARLFTNDRKEGSRSAEWRAMLEARFRTSGIPLYVTLSPGDEVLGTLVFPGGATAESFAGEMAALLDAALAKVPPR